MNAHFWKHLALVPLAAILFSCPAQPDFTVLVNPSSSVVVQGKTLEVAVKLERIGNFAEAVNVSLTNPAPGITADVLTIAGSSSSGVLIVKSDASGTAKLTEPTSE